MSDHDKEAWKVEKREQEQAAEAWAKLASRLETQEASPLWSEWASEASSAASNKTIQTQGAAPKEQPQVANRFDKQRNVVPLGRARTSIADAASRGTAPRQPWHWLRKHGGKLTAACAAAIITVIISVPSANEALAAWLGKFQVNEVVVVQEDDLQAVWNSFALSQDNEENINRFGSFERQITGQWSVIGLEEAEARLGFKLPVLPSAEHMALEVREQPGSAITMRLNVQELNEAMKKLGANKLLPESIDDKAITLESSQGVSLSYMNTKAGTNQGFTVNYSEVPSITVDPSLEVEEAYEAIIDFPLLPDHLRHSLLQSVDLKKGKIPLPLVSGNKQMQMEVAGTTVYLEQYATTDYSNAVWLQNGKLVQASFSEYAELEDIKALLTELVQA